LSIPTGVFIFMVFFLVNKASKKGATQGLTDLLRYFIYGSQAVTLNDL